MIHKYIHTYIACIHKYTPVLCKCYRPPRNFTLRYQTFVFLFAANLTYGHVPFLIYMHVCMCICACMYVVRLSGWFLLRGEPHLWTGSFPDMYVCMYVCVCVCVCMHAHWVTIRLFSSSRQNSFKHGFIVCYTYMHAYMLTYIHAYR